MQGILMNYSPDNFYTLDSEIHADNLKYINSITF